MVFLFSLKEMLSCGLSPSDTCADLKEFLKWHSFHLAWGTISFELDSKGPLDHEITLMWRSIVWGYCPSIWLPSSLIWCVMLYFLFQEDFLEYVLLFTLFLFFKRQDLAV